MSDQWERFHREAMSSHGSVSFDAVAPVDGLMVGHGGGRWSLAVGPKHGAVKVWANGTVAEMRSWLASVSALLDELDARDQAEVPS